MERETQKLETPNGKKFEIYTYVTGREIRCLTQFSEEREKGLDEMIKIGLVSFEESTENKLERILDLPGSEYVFVINAITELFTAVTEEKKTI